MKNPLSYQATEYDCGPTSVLNAVKFLFHRHEISPDILKSIMLYTLDGYNTKGEPGKSGTSGMAMLFLSNWLNHFSKIKKWPISCEMMTGHGVRVGQNTKIAECLQQGGSVVVKVMLGCWHYVTLTGIDEEYVYLFDPYYRKNSFKEEGIDMIKDQPTKMNRRVRHEVMNSLGKGNYAMGKEDTRECVIFFNEKTRQSMENIEYFI